MAKSTKYFYAVGRRKRSTAVVKLFPNGSGNITIKKGENTVTIQDYFGGHYYMVEDALSPFTILGATTVKSYDAEIVVRGGGLLGQAEAIRLGFSRGLVLQDPEMRKQLKPYGLLKRDPRIKERKKPGLKKARKSPQWSKR